MITANDIVKANEVLKNVVERTPLDFDRYLSEKYGATIYIKKENMQKYPKKSLTIRSTKV